MIQGLKSKLRVSGTHGTENYLICDQVVDLHNNNNTIYHTTTSMTWFESSNGFHFGALLATPKPDTY